MAYQRPHLINYLPSHIDTINIVGRRWTPEEQATLPEKLDTILIGAPNPWDKPIMETKPLAISDCLDLIHILENEFIGIVPILSTPDEAGFHKVLVFDPNNVRQNDAIKTKIDSFYK